MATKTKIPRQYLVVGGVAGGLLLLLYLSRRGASSSAGASGAATAAPTGNPYGPPASVNPLQPILISQGPASSAATSAASTSPYLSSAEQAGILSSLKQFWASQGFAALTPGQYSGSGVFEPGEQITASGQHYIEAPSLNVAQPYLAAGNAYYEPTPGTFVPTSGQGLAPNTPIYLPVSQ